MVRGTYGQQLRRWLEFAINLNDQVIHLYGHSHSAPTEPLKISFPIMIMTRHGREYRFVLFAITVTHGPGEATETFAEESFWPGSL